MINVTSKKKTQKTGAFYDVYWPRNVPDYRKTREHVHEIVPPGPYGRAIDGGCGTGVCSLALSELADEVVALDISRGSIKTGEGLAAKLGKDNIRFCQGSLLDIPFPDDSFDLAFSWGVIHHTVNPVQALDELVRVLKPGGTIVLAIYLKTALTPLHEGIRRICLHIPRKRRKPILRAFSRFVSVAERFGFTPRERNDNPTVESLIEDWYFVPEKHFYSIEEMRRLFKARGLTYEVVSEQTGRFKSTSNFIVRGVLAK